LSNARNSREFYTALSYLCSKRTDFLITESVKPEDFRSYYSNLFRDNTISKVTMNYEDNLPVEDSFLDAEFSFSELNDCIKKLAKCKAPGPDAIVNEIWKGLDVTNRLCLLD
jgi:hypothetical protein